MRVQYAQMHSVILDLAATFVQQMQRPTNSRSGSSENKNSRQSTTDEERRVPRNRTSTATSDADGGGGGVDASKQSYTNGGGSAELRYSTYTDGGVYRGSGEADGTYFKSAAPPAVDFPSFFTAPPQYPQTTPAAAPPSGDTAGVPPRSSVCSCTSSSTSTSAADNAAANAAAAKATASRRKGEGASSPRGPARGREEATEVDDAEVRARAASFAKREFLRLLNLTHVLFLSQAGEKEHTIATAKALQGGFWKTLRWGCFGRGNRKGRIVCKIESFTLFTGVFGVFD